MRIFTIFFFFLLSRPLACDVLRLERIGSKKSFPGTENWTQYAPGSESFQKQKQIVKTRSNRLNRFRPEGFRVAPTDFDIFFFRRTGRPYNVRSVDSHQHDSFAILLLVIFSLSPSFSLSRS